MENTTLFSKNYPLTILIAGDDPEIQETTKGILDQLGYQTEMAKNCEELLDRTSVKTYDVILLDIHMQGADEMLDDGLHDGFDRDQCRPPLIVGISGNGRPDFRQICLRAKVDHCIEKPVDPQEWRLQLKAFSILTGKCRVRE